MPTTTDYLNQLQTDKQNLVNNLVEKGVSASNDETFTSLVPKVLDIQTGSDEYNAKVDAEIGTSDKFFKLLTEIPETNTSQRTSMSGYYADLNNVVNFPMVDTSNSTNFYQTYYQCYRGLNFPKIDTSKGTNFSYMYYKCLDVQQLPEIDTHLGTNFSNMYSSCNNLINTPLIDTSNGTNFSNMYNSCRSVAEPALINTSKGVNFSSMYNSCYAMTNPPLIDVANGVDFNGMYAQCRGILKVPNLNISSKATNLYGMFDRCLEVIEADLSNWDLSGVTNASANYNGVYNMFNGCSKLKIIILPASLQYIQGYFAKDCSSLDTLICLSETPPVLGQTNWLNNTPIRNKNGFIYVPDNSVDAYKTASNWSTYADQIKGMSELPV